MRARLVTGYVPLHGHPRTASEYGDLGEKLSGVPVRKKAFYQRVEETWLYRYVKALPTTPAISVSDNPRKNTLAYHSVQHEKIEWLRQAAVECDDDVVVWVDYGIFHQSGMCNEAIYRFMGSVDDRHIYAPGCWGATPDVSSFMPCWRFCGSVLAVPAKHVAQLATAVRETAMQHIAKTGVVDWEVNTWARVEQAYPELPFQWYKADHDVSQFTELPCLVREVANEP